MNTTLRKMPLAKADPRLKNRVGGFGSQSSYCTRSKSSQVLETESETSVSVTITVSGLPFWPSRDPMGERGDFNLYAFVYNSPVNLVDRRGLIGFPGVSGAPEMQKIVKQQMPNKASEVCGKGEGIHSVSRSGQVTFNPGGVDGDIRALLLNISHWSFSGNGDVTKDSSCPKCLKYSLATDWNVIDTIDCRSYDSLRDAGYFLPGNGMLGDALGYIEGFCEKIGLNILGIHVDVKWTESDGGCCG